jgi:hypothetical protein
VTHLHRYQPVINHDFLGKEVGAYCRLVACAELLVDLYLLYKLRSPAWYMRRQYVYSERWSRTYWFIRLVLPTPLSPRIMTCIRQRGTASRTSAATTLRRTFFLEAIVYVECVCEN